MGWSFLSDAPSHVQFIMAFACVLMGISHIVQPGMWRDYFTVLHGEGPRAIVTRTFVLEFWPALIIVAFHQVWSGPGIVLTLYGWALLTKCTLSILWPRIGLRSLAMAQKGDKGFVIGGVGLMLVGVAAGAALVGG